MSASNVELARLGFEAVARGDLDAVGVILDPDVQWHGSEGPGMQSCHSRAEVLEFIRQAVRRGALGELVDVIGAGDHDVVVVMRAGRALEPGESELRANLATFRDGKVVRMIAYETPEAALAATPT
jgi:ketosteroid isomerase-like protein